MPNDEWTEWSAEVRSKQQTRTMDGLPSTVRHPSSAIHGLPFTIHRSPFCLVPLCLLFFGCSPTYVLRAGYEEAKILWRREPIEDMLQRADLDPATRAKLELVLAVRRFARDTLELRVDGSYATFARVDADQVVHVVTAAYQLRLEPYTWWFPIVGRVPYKGFFSRASADDEAQCLERSGYDTYVRPSVAFSTLGWFADPLLSNLLRYDRATLADVIIHELLHNTSYLAGRADFDESFANFVGLRGAIAFFAARGDEADHAQAQAAWDEAARFSDFIGRFTARLRDAYATGVALSDRQRLFAEAQEEFNRWPERPESYRDFGTERLNNAVILHYLMYADRLQLFETVFEQQHRDLRRTIQIVIDTVHRNGKDPFTAVQDLQNPAGNGERVVRAAVTARLLPGVVPRNARSTRRPPASA
jgi:predicted aminopeptidase